ncbi:MULTISPECIES: YgaP family membrane protein [Heyndrickxia]|jgi:hypothetical protein|uniref:Uncharacterized protein n=1 Tax=Heyndrickxia oleronia TaxID=38875 RepID=A0A8E2I6E8_9BACI|nr:DUF2892 domain-containing protein [Heyndrickxia oleronia]NYV68720.1 DUF2892 domain-containing protein [Bacillus sp. Gen3]OJH16609.1 hypothetical protein BLX88_22390 [Bacillus obstructivus]MBU5213867.1 DUF2892 domain-containing protein [Heyndrickxia oleronia]MCI1589849.1 DUF2892 domain-containing protein [Heyndrickxia oleronia]MCI1613443.1 DUF2892 domain-containing protein [Heyndrickxia oleronia]
MKITPNIGILNALIRITCGLTLLSWSSAKLSKKPWCNSYIIVMILSAMKVAEGIVRYCPVTELLKNGQNPMGSNKGKEEHSMTPAKHSDNQTDINVMKEIKNFQDQLKD